MMLMRMRNRTVDERADLLEVTAGRASQRHCDAQADLDEQGRPGREPRVTALEPVEV